MLSLMFSCTSVAVDSQQDRDNTPVGSSSPLTVMITPQKVSTLPEYPYSHLNSVLLDRVTLPLCLCHAMPCLADLNHPSIPFHNPLPSW